MLTKCLVKRIDQSIYFRSLSWISKAVIPELTGIRLHLYLYDIKTYGQRDG